MNNILIDIRPTFEKLAAGYQRAGSSLVKSLSLALQEFAFTIERYSKQVTPVDTGRMRSSIAVDMIGGGQVAKIGTHNVHYASYVHEGTYKMRARPFMSWGLNFAITKFNNASFGDRIEQSLRESLTKL